MSKSNASAKSRRAFIDPNKTQNSLQSSINNPNTQPVNSTNTGLTLQQVIAVIDKRLLNVELFVKETRDTNDLKDLKNDLNKKVNFQENTLDYDKFDEIISEFNSRFELLTEEISNLKDIIIKLQSFTMDVNKSLMEERAHVFSDLGTIITDNTDNNTYSINNNNENDNDNNENDNDN
jgi:hypothetical protein